MAGLLPYSLAGLGFLLLSILSLLSPSSFPSPPPLPSSLLSFLLFLYSLLSLFLSSPSLLPLPLLSLSLLFLLTFLSSLLLPLPPPLLSLLSLSSFLLELIYLSLLHLDQVQSHYFSLLSVPSLLCLLSFLPLSSPFPSIARSAGLALHGTWIIQMGFSIFSSFGIAHGCNLNRTSWSVYSVKCKGHMEYHRAKALATLQFNCHLALVVVIGVVVYGFMVGRRQGGGGGDGYRPIGKEVQMMGVSGNGGSHFVLDDDDDEEEGIAVTVETNGVHESHP